MRNFYISYETYAFDTGKIVTLGLESAMVVLDGVPQRLNRVNDTTFQTLPAVLTNEITTIRVRES